MIADALQRKVEEIIERMRSDRARMQSRDAGDVVFAHAVDDWADELSDVLATVREESQARCDHKFIDSTHCLKCGWTPPAEGCAPELRCPNCEHATPHTSGDDGNNCEQMFCVCCSRATAEGRATVREAPMKRHGIDCPKVKHLGEGYLHGPDDDRPYDVDGVTYCGRCHGWLGSPVAEGRAPEPPKEGSVDGTTSIVDLSAQRQEPDAILNGEGSSDSPIEVRVPHELPANPGREITRADYDELLDALISALEERPNKSGEYTHLLICSGDRRKAPGTPGSGCVCLRNKKAALVKLEAQEARPAPPLDWHPIATAPTGSWPDGPQDTRDTSYVKPPCLWLTLQDGQRCVGYFDAYYAEGGNAYDGAPPWVEAFSGDRIRPTHWMPLPDPPAAVPQE